MPLTVIDGPHFKAGDSVSDAVDCTGGRVVRITCPTGHETTDAGWTPALLTFMISTDGLIFNDVYDFTGDPVTINVVPGAAMLVPETLGKAAEFLKFRSGAPKNPIPQAFDRNFAIAIETVSPVVVPTENVPKP